VPYRNCQQANIPEYLCTCHQNKKIDLSEKDLQIAQNAAQFLVEYINTDLLADHQNICIPLEFKQISDAQIVDKKFSKYSIIFETNPNGAIFDSLVSMNSTNNRFNLIGKISRVTLYGSTANCMDSNFLKNYCYCRSYLNATDIPR